MKPVEIAKALYRKHKDRVQNKTFEERVATIRDMPQGAIRSTPTCFAMGYAADIDGKQAWYVEVAVGRLQEILSLMPFYLPYVAFSHKRKPKLMTYETNRILRRVKC